MKLVAALGGGWSAGGSGNGGTSSAGDALSAGSEGSSTGAALALALRQAALDRRRTALDRRWAAHRPRLPELESAGAHGQLSAGRAETRSSRAGWGRIWAMLAVTVQPRPLLLTLLPPDDARLALAARGALKTRIARRACRAGGAKASDWFRQVSCPFNAGSGLKKSTASLIPVGYQKFLQGYLILIKKNQLKLVTNLSSESKAKWWVNLN